MSTGEKTIGNRLTIACLMAFAGFWNQACADNGDAPSAGEQEESPEREVLLLAEEKADHPDFGEIGRMEDRTAMVETQILARDIADEAVVQAMKAVPRHELVPEGNRSQAYADRPLPIGYGQTISQPYIVALMTEKLQLEEEDRVLEVGTGSGYQAAILGMIVQEVVTIEIIRPLATDAAADLKRLGYDNVTVMHGDGYFGYAPEAPYDAIVVTAAAEHVPPPLIAQLRPGGRMVIPVGRSAWTQNLLLVEKNSDGEVSTQNLLPVRFVPLTREAR